jgi:hypothetical protein
VELSIFEEGGFERGRVGATVIEIWLQIMDGGEKGGLGKFCHRF